jgi:catechol 2,3-dioxygenase-like lactoylglutathione lyase family enzyme
MSEAPSVTGLLETCLYVDDLERARRFYREVMHLEEMSASDRLIAFNVGPSRVLLVFDRATCTEDVDSSKGTIPGHFAKGPMHVAFAIAESASEDWRAWLEKNGLKIRSTMRWDRGGQSLYFEDPDGNVIELATPGLWPNY